MRNVLEISPGQVPSLRADPQTSNTRLGVAALPQAAWAFSMLALVASHSTDMS